MPLPKWIDFPRSEEILNDELARAIHQALLTMHLMYTLDEDGNRVYTLKKVTDAGKTTKSAHPARFSPDDKFSRHRVTIKKRFGVLLTQLPSKPL